MAAAYSRSGFELRLRERLDAEKVTYAYEKTTFPIDVAVAGYCLGCGSRKLARESTYTPDFFFPIWVVEAKGKFTPKDRKRVLALLAGNPQIRGRFAMLFQRDNWLTKRRAMRYTEWCAEHDIPSAVGWFKQEWLR